MPLKLVNLRSFKKLMRPLIYISVLLQVSGCSILDTSPKTSTFSHLHKKPTIQTEEQFRKLLSKDDKAIVDITRWLEEYQEKIKTDISLQRNFIQLTQARLLDVRQAYENFLAINPDHNGARAAYASFLTYIRDEQGAIDQWHHALKSDSANATLWNNLATHLGTLSIETESDKLIPNILDNFNKSVNFAPDEPLYHNNYATALSLYSVKAADHYQTSQASILNKASEHFHKAHTLAPKDFNYAADYAESFLDIRPLQYPIAIEAWNKARQLAKKNIQIQWVELQVAILEIEDGKINTAKTRLSNVTDQSFSQLKERLLKRITNSNKK